MKQKRQKRIGFDLDGVLADHKKNIKIMVDLLGYADIIEKMSIYEVKKKVPPSDHKRIQKSIYGKVSLDADVMSESRGVLKRLENSFETFLISRRRPEHSQHARQWLTKYFNFSPGRVFFVDKDEDKPKLAKELGLGFFIDDKLSILKLFPAEIKTFLFDEFYFYEGKNIDDITVVHSFNEFLKLINK